MTKTGSLTETRRKTLVRLTAVTILILLASFAANAGEMTGREVIETVYSQATPETVKATLTMKLINKDGGEKVREMAAWHRGDDCSIMVFKKPESFAGTALLKTTDEKGEENTWLYLPSLNLTKKIDQESGNQNFMGSDFSYDDLGARNIDEYTYELLREEESETETVYVVEAKAKDPETTGYYRLVSWISDKHWKPREVEYYDRNGELLKVQLNSEIEEVEDYLVVKEMTMEDKQGGGRTILTWKEYEINKELPEGLFSPDSLPGLIEEE